SANNTRSAFISNSLPGISRIVGRPFSPFAHSRRTPCSFFTLPCASPENDFVLMLQSRITPSSCEDDVRRIIGQYGHGAISSVRVAGGGGSSSNWCTDLQP